MHFSATSYMMAILGGTCLICFLCIIMKNNRITGTLSIRFLKYFSIFILIRMMLPFEFFHTITIPSMKILPAIFDFCNEHVLFSFGNTAVTLSRLLLFIWIAGIICIAFNTFRNYLILYGIIRSLPDITDAPDNPVSAVLAEIYEKNPVPHPVFIVISLTQPPLPGVYPQTKPLSHQFLSFY